MSFVLDASYGEQEGELYGIVLSGDNELRDVTILTPSIELSAEEASQFTFVVHDPKLELLSTGRLGVGATLDYLDLRFRISGIEVGGGSDAPTIAVTCLSAGVMTLRERKGPLVVSNQSPTTFARREAESVGLGFVGEDSAPLAAITRADPSDGETKDAESSWDVIRRLADEIGFVAFEAAGTLYFAKPSWLIGRPGVRTWVVRYPEATAFGELGCLEVPTCRRTVASEPPVTIDASLMQYHASPIRPGDKVVFAGVPTFEGDYLVTNVPITVDGVTPSTVSFATPVDPEPKPAVADEPYAGDTALEALFGQSDYERGEEDDTFEPPPSASIGGFGGVGRTWRWPCGGPVTSRFGPRVPPKAGASSFHRGLDIGAATGTPVYAAKGGVVITAEALGGAGNAVVINHGGGVVSKYFHLSRIVVQRTETAPPRSVGRAVGDANYGGVAQGSLIGYVGKTGNVTGAHLHFEIWVSGTAENPEDLLPLRAVKTGANLRAV